MTYQCPKCGFTQYEKGTMHATGGFWSKIFDIQSRKFTTVSCKKCSYTEFYSQNTGDGGNIFDFLTS